MVVAGVPCSGRSDCDSGCGVGIGELATGVEALAGGEETSVAPVMGAALAGVRRIGSVVEGGTEGSTMVGVRLTLGSGAVWLPKVSVPLGARSLAGAAGVTACGTLSSVGSEVATLPDRTPAPVVAPGGASDGERWAGGVASLAGGD